MWRYRIIIIICLIVVVGILSFWLSRSEKSVTMAPLPIPSPAPSQEAKGLIFPSDTLVTKKPTYRFETSPKQEQGAVPIFRVGLKGDLSLLARRFAVSFGKSGTPKTFSTSGKTYYSWSDGDNTFSVGGKPVEIAYQIPLPQGLSIISEPVAVFGALARSFLVSKNLIPFGTTLSSPVVTYYSPLGNDPTQTTVDKATVVRLDYRLLVDGRPLYVGSPEIPIFSLRFDSTKTLVSFSGYYFEPFQKTVNASLVTVDTARASLYTNGSLVYVFSPEDANDVRTKKYTPGVIAIDNTTLGYFYDPEQSLLVPIYIFTGSSKQGKTNKTLETVTFLSAIADR